MSSLIYLLIAVVLSVVGTLVLMYRHRKPTSMEHGIDEFHRELKALSPERRVERKRRDEDGRPG